MTKLSSGYQPQELKEICSRNLPEEGWEDVFFSIVATSSTENSKIYICKGLYQSKTIGFQIEIRADIGKDAAAGPNPYMSFTQDAVQFRSIGAESDAMIQALAVQYGFPTNRAFTSQSSWLTVFSLNQKAVNLDKKDNYQLKIFFNQDHQPYAECFLNINTLSSEIELKEKDKSFREAIIHNLTL